MARDGLRVLVLGVWFPYPPRWGWAVRVYHLARQLARTHDVTLLTYGAHHMQHMHKALQQMNLTLSQVVSDLTGAPGMAILRAIIAGERAPPHPGEAVQPALPP